MNLMKDRSEKTRVNKELTKLFGVREQGRLRDLYGRKYVDFINSVMNKSLSLDNFDTNLVEPMPLRWSKDLVNSEGLVVAYVNKIDAGMIFTCIQSRVGTVSGLIGFHEKSYLGLARVDKVAPFDLLAVAEVAEDSVVFYNDFPFGVIMVDCYLSQPGDPFSIIIQGDDLVSELRKCFAEKAGL